MSNVIINDVEVHLVARDGSIFANSLEVANVFEKPHKDVLVKVRSMSDRAGRNFSLKSYQSNGKELPMFEMNRDGFMFLAMGFTGEKAENWKLDLIDAFNTMEQSIRQYQKPLTIQEQIAIIAKGNQIIDERLTLLEQTKRLEAWQERALIDAKNKKVYSFNPSDAENTSKLHRAVWSHFKKRFNLPRYNELPSVKFEDGLSFINSITLIDLV